VTSKRHIQGVLSSLTDTSVYPAQDILDVYFERWEIENSYAELKHQMLEDSILLRSQSVDGVYQEIWGVLLAYNTNHIKYLISSEPHRHLNPRRIDEEMVIPF